MQEFRLGGGCGAIPLPARRQVEAGSLAGAVGDFAHAGRQLSRFSLPVGITAQQSREFNPPQITELFAIGIETSHQIGAALTQLGQAQEGFEALLTGTPLAIAGVIGHTLKVALEGRAQV